MDRDTLQAQIDAMFPNGARVVVGADSPQPIAFWTARVAVLSPRALYIIPLFWERGGEFVGDSDAEVEDGEVVFPKAYLRADERLDIRLDTRFNPVGLEDQIKHERALRSAEWLKVTRLDFDRAQEGSDG